MRKWGKTAKKKRELWVDKFSTAYARHKWLGHAHRTGGGDGQQFCIHTNMFVFFFGRWLNFQVQTVARLKHNHTSTLHAPMYSRLARMYGTKRQHWTVEWVKSDGIGCNIFDGTRVVVTLEISTGRNQCIRCWTVPFWRSFFKQFMRDIPIRMCVRLAPYWLK